MGFRVKFAGLEVTCDTADDVLALAARAGPSPIRKVLSEVTDNGSNRAWTPSVLKIFWSRLKDNQRKMLSELVDHPEGRSDEELCRLLKLSDNRRLAGVFTGLYKNAYRSGANPDKVYVRERLFTNEGRSLRYTLSKDFRVAWEEFQAKAKK